MSDEANKGTSKTAALVITSLSQFLAPIMATTVNVALPSIGKEFGAEAVLLGWVANIYTLAATIFLIPCGRIADIYGRKKVFACGIWLFAISSTLGGFSNSVTMLIVTRVFQGIAAAIIYATGTAILTSVIPAPERGRSLGIYVATVYFGLSIGPFIGGVLTENLTWRSNFFLSTLISVIAGILVLWKLPGEWADARGEKFDYAGSIIFSLAMFLMMYGFSTLPAASGLVMLTVGIGGMVLFFKQAQKSGSPLLDIRTMRNNRIFILSCIASLINYCGTFAVTFLLSFYLQYNKGFSPQMAGLILIAQPVVQTIFAPIAGILSDRMLPQKVAALGMALTGLGLIPLIFFTESTGLWFIISSLAFLGVGCGIFATPNINALMGSVEQRFLGIAGATLSTMRNLGMVFSMGVVMILFTIFIGNSQITAQNYSSYLESQKVSFIIFAILCFVGIFIQIIAVKTEMEQTI